MTLLTAKEAASRLGVSVTTVYALCNRHAPALRHMRIGPKGGIVRIPADAIGEYLTSAELSPADKPPPARAYVPRFFRY